MAERRERRPRGLRSNAAKLIAVLVVLIAAGQVCRWLWTPEHWGDPPPKRSVCANRLRQLGEIYVFEHLESGRFPEAGGAPLFLSYRRKHRLQWGREEVLVCPADPDAHEPEGEEDSDLYDTVDLADAHSIAALCSYAVRDFARFPVTVEERDSGRRIWIACDRQGRDGRTPHHPGGLNVLFDDGAVVFMISEQFGLAPDAPIVVGPGSPHPELRKMVFAPEE